jgi:hypothetical protein
MACLLGTFRMTFTRPANCPNQLLVRRIIAFLSNQSQAYYASSSESFRSLPFSADLPSCIGGCNGKRNCWTEPSHAVAIP